MSGDTDQRDQRGLRRAAALAAMLASGAAGLGYQIVWTQQSTLWLGHESAAVLAVITAFFGGLALGALVLGSRVERSTRPGLWYGVCELVIAAWGGAMLLGLAPFSEALHALTGARPAPAWQWTVAFAGTFVVLLPATAAMGATLPAMARVVEHLGRERGAIGALYAGNTLGAVVGVLGAAFWMVPSFGLTRTALVCIALNLACAAAALTLFPAATPPARAVREPGRRHLQIRLAATGLLGIGYEVLVVRVLSQVNENTVFTFAMLLAVYLLGTAFGAAAYQRWLPRVADPVDLSDRLLAGLAVSCLIGTGSLWAAETLRDSAQRAFGAGLEGALGAEAVLALVAFALPTLVMGALFSHFATQARADGIGFGRALGINTLGAAAAPLVFGVFVAPALGAKLALLVIAAGYLLLVSSKARTAPATWAAAGAAGALAVFAPPLIFVQVPEGGRLVSYREGPMAAVSVVEDAAGVSRLRIDNRQQEGSSDSLYADARQALVPLLLHPAPQRALFLGLGTGVTAGAAARDPALQVDAVELLPEVIEASSHFAGPPGSAPRPRLIAADARRFVRSGGDRYDLIVSDNFHPARSGSGSLYTVEHFAAVEQRLAANGVFCQWLPLHQLDLDTLRSIVRSFTQVYPDASALLATHSLETPVIGLVARADHRPLDLARLRERLADAGRSQRLVEFGLVDEFAVLGAFVAGPASLARFAAGAPLNTDDHPVVAHTAPRITYAPDSSPRERLSALLGLLSIDPQDVVDAGADTAWPPRLAAYWRARDQFIEAGLAVRPTADPARMLAQVREPLLAALRSSPDFRPAYDPLLRLATALASTDPREAGGLLRELVERQPARPEAAAALSRLPTSR